MHLRSTILAGLGLLVSATAGAHLPLSSRSHGKPRCLVEENLPQKRGGRRLLDYVPTAETIVVKTYVHIIARDKTVAGGWVTVSRPRALASLNVFFFLFSFFLENHPTELLIPLPARVT